MNISDNSQILIDSPPGAKFKFKERFVPPKKLASVHASGPCSNASCQLAPWLSKSAAQEPFRRRGLPAYSLAASSQPFFYYKCLGIRQSMLKKIVKLKLLE